MSGSKQTEEQVGVLDEAVKVSDLGEFIKGHRERANLSLRRLAERAGISNPYLSQIERGVRKPSAEILKRLSRALSISAETLYTRAGLIEAGPEPPAVIDAIEADAVLSPRQKQVLLDLYRTLVSAAAATEEPQEQKQGKK
ncbi:MAG TPA: helix-turn-helix transcriptional regulator [Acidimicrobiia bacterium]|nr:helix-turn-helix transcriptional regulator [Acidimicrobiia bacterium]